MPDKQNELAHLTDKQEVISDFVEIMNDANPQPTDGSWLEDVACQVAPLISNWNVKECHPYTDWPDREKLLPDHPPTDTGIDLVAVRADDGRHIAIQCKSRQLDDDGAVQPISKKELDSFMSASDEDVFVERWLVTNGNVPLGKNALQFQSKLEQKNMTHDLYGERDFLSSVIESLSEVCLHCDPPAHTSDDESDPPMQTKSCMQREAVSESVAKLKELAGSARGGIPKGQARGKIILPCGTGKTRISLRIVEELTPSGKLSVVLCPSIALVAQIQDEYMKNRGKTLRPLAVCSDQTAGYNPAKEGDQTRSLDPTADTSNVSASEIKGATTDPEKIAEWIKQGSKGDAINVIFGTYQSGHQIAKALKSAKASVEVLVCDEAHRTAGLRSEVSEAQAQKSKAKAEEKEEDETKLRDFSLCHNQDAFPAKYRIYQTATPREYGKVKKIQQKVEEGSWVVRSMDDESTFGVDLYRKRYIDAVRNGWLADYRIIAIGINDMEAYERASALASQDVSGSRQPLTTNDGVRGLGFAMAMAGATRTPDNEVGSIDIKSCIAFMNTVHKSKTMSELLQENKVRDWLKNWCADNNNGVIPDNVDDFTLAHVDASNNVATRNSVKHSLGLAANSETPPYAVINVGIFSEGTDSPNLSAVAFLEPRRSPVDVIQAVGRAMRTSKDKKFGYIVVPMLMPTNQDPETWLANSPMSEWPVLGQILQALRSHDERIEDNISELLEISYPTNFAENVDTLVVLGVDDGNSTTTTMYEFTGKSGEAEYEAYQMAETGTRSKKLREVSGDILDDQSYSSPSNTNPSQIVTVKKKAEEIKTRIANVPRHKPKKNETQGEVDTKKLKKLATAMLNEIEGQKLSKQEIEQKRKRRSKREELAPGLFERLEWDENANAIQMNLLDRSGLATDLVERDLNLLASGVNEAAHHLRQDNLQPTLDSHFGLDNLEENKERADGVTIAALLLMNAAMLHQRIANGGWIPNVSDLTEISGETNIIDLIDRQWNAITRQDFEPVIIPALEVLYAIKDTGKTACLERALGHLTSRAAEIAQAYAEMGADHAGALFNKVMGDQSSDGAFFTRPITASMVARLALDAMGEVDWTDPKVWEANRVLDPACGSGTLLAAALTDMKRRAKDAGAYEQQLANLHKLGVEETISGLDINAISLQLAAARLTATNQNISFERMGLYQMPYGLKQGTQNQVSAGSLELLGQRALVHDKSKLDIEDEQIESRVVWKTKGGTYEVQKAIKSVEDVRLLIMNPPFTNRVKMGEKFVSSEQEMLRRRVDNLKQHLVNVDGDMDDFVTSNSIGPLFVALADQCLPRDAGVLAMIKPTIQFSGPSGIRERQILASRFNIDTILTCHDPKQINLSENTNINESIIVAKRRGKAKQDQPTRFISLDRLPASEEEVEELHEALRSCPKDGGELADGWGEVSYWPAERMIAGDWSAGVWRSPKLAEAAWRFANHPALTPMGETDIAPKSVPIGKSSGYVEVKKGTEGCFPVLNLSSADAQQYIRSKPDAYFKRDDSQQNEQASLTGETKEQDNVLDNAGYPALSISWLRTSHQNAHIVAREHTAPCVAATVTLQVHRGSSPSPRQLLDPRVGEQNTPRPRTVALSCAS